MILTAAPRATLPTHPRHHLFNLDFTQAGKKQAAVFEKGSAESCFDSADFNCKEKGRRVMRSAHNSSLPVLLPILEARTGRKVEHEEKSK